MNAKNFAIAAGQLHFSTFFLHYDISKAGQPTPNNATAEKEKKSINIKSEIDSITTKTVASTAVKRH